MSTNPSEIVGSSRCGLQDSVRELFEEARTNARNNLLRRECKQRRIVQADGTVEFVPAGKVTRSGNAVVRGRRCSVGGITEGIRIYFILDPHQSEVECQNVPDQKSSQNSL